MKPTPTLAAAERQNLADAAQRRDARRIAKPHRQRRVRNVWLKEAARF